MALGVFFFSADIVGAADPGTHAQTAPEHPRGKDEVRMPGEPVISQEERKILEEAKKRADAAPAAAAAWLRGQARPGEAPALWFAAGAYFARAGDLDAAIEAFRQAVTAKPDFYRARLNLARLLVRSEKWREAADALVELLGRPGPEKPAVWTLLGYVRLQQGRPTAAAVAYRQALALRPDDSAVRRGLVQCLIDLQRWEEAAAMVREDLRRRPTDPDLWRLLARIDLARDDSDAALVHLDCARRLGDITGDERAVLAALLLRKRLVDDGLAVLKSAPPDKPVPPERLLDAADVLLSLGRTRDARELLESIRATGIDRLPAAVKARLFYEQARAAEAAGSLSEARKLYERAVDEAPLFGPALLGLGDVLLRSGEPDRAEFYYDRAARRSEYRVQALVHKARAATERGAYEQAALCLEQALRLEPAAWIRDYLDQVRQALANSATATPAEAAPPQNPGENVPEE